MEQLITTKIKYGLDKREIERFVSLIATLDALGRLIDEPEYASNGATICTVTQRFSRTGKLESKVEYDAIDQLLERQTFIEDDSGDITQAITEFGDGSKTIKSFEFAQLGIVEKVTITDEDDHVVGQEFYIYNEEGHVTEERVTDPEGVELSRYKKMYNSEGWLVEETYFEQDQLVHVEQFEYNAAGALAKTTKKDANGRLLFEEWKAYDSDGKETNKVTIDHASGYRSEEIHEYDPQGNVVSISVMSEGKLLFRNECTYSDNGVLSSEEIMEVDLSGRLTRHEKLVHEWQEL